MKQIPYELANRLNVNKHKYFIQTHKEITIFMGYRFVFEKGFVTDQCSYPVFIQKFLIKIFGIKKIKKGNSDCKLHDATYAKQYPCKLTSDIILLCRSFRTSKFLAIVKFIGVLFFGFWAYYKTDSVDEYNKSYCKVTRL